MQIVAIFNIVTLFLERPLYKGSRYSQTRIPLSDKRNAAIRDGTCAYLLYDLQSLSASVTRRFARFMQKSSYGIARVPFGIIHH